MANPNVFTQIEVTTPEYSTFDLSHDVKMSCNMGILYPCLAMDILPGDRVNLSGNMLVRMAPMTAPIMHKIDAFIHYFFVPNRILWPQWETFFTGANLEGPNAGPTPAHPWITLNNANYTTYPLFDYLGMPAPTVASGDTLVNVIPLAAYQKVWNDYYRDQNVASDLSNLILLQPGDNTVNITALAPLRRRAWEHDYLTSALPYAQKGAAVDIPLGLITLNPDWDLESRSPVWRDTTMANAPDSTQNVNNDIAGNGYITTTPTATRVAYDPDGSLVNAPTAINDLRIAYRFQRWLELNARGGTRYTESLLVQFGVRSSDARLQRPEYISGVKVPIVISEVLSTVPTNPATPEIAPQGNMAGHGIAISEDNYGSYQAEEHGWIIGILSIRPKTAYQDGLEKKFQRFDRLDYAIPIFANLGEQAILNSEVNLNAPGLEKSGTFGYTPRYSEYKFMNSRVAGDFKTNLAFWHLGRQFDTENVTLSQNFIECNPSYRIFAVDDNNVDHFYCHIHHSIEARRPLPYFGTPTW